MEHGWHDGFVTEIYFDEHGKELYHVVYEDKDAEDLDEDEMALWAFPHGLHAKTKNERGSAQHKIIIKNPLGHEMTSWVKNESGDLVLTFQLNGEPE